MPGDDDGAAARPKRDRRPPQIPENLPMLLSADLSAAILGASRHWFDAQVSAGKIPPADVRIGCRFIRWRRTTIEGVVERLADAAESARR